MIAIVSLIATAYIVVATLILLLQLLLLQLMFLSHIHLNLPPANITVTWFATQTAFLFPLCLACLALGPLEAFSTPCEGVGNIV